MKTKVYIGIAVRIILLFSVGMLASLATPLMRDFFGDTLHVHTISCAKQFDGCVEEYDVLYDWGSRHYWYFWMMVVLFILSIINFVVSVINIIDKNYPTK